jgi:hypothetical protein
MVASAVAVCCSSDCLSSLSNCAFSMAITAWAAKLDEIRRLLVTINSNAEDRTLAQDVLDDAFETRWPELESKVRNILRGATPIIAPKERDERSLLEEVVGVVRSLHTEQRDLHDAVNYIMKAVSPTPNELMVNSLRGGVSSTTYDAQSGRWTNFSEPTGTSIGRGSALGVVDPGAEKGPFRSA